MPTLPRLLLNGLEVDQIAHFDAQGSSNLAQNIDAYIGRPGFDFPEVRAARSCHQSKTALRDTLLLPGGFDSKAETFLFASVIHSPSVGVLLLIAALYGEPLFS